MGLRFLDRDTSWMDFNERVLTCAADPSIPLLERVNFLAITAANLDEFFQVRVGELADETKHLHLANRRQEIVSTILERAHDFTLAQIDIFRNLSTELAQHDIKLSSVEDLDIDSKGWMSEYFDEHVYPVLTPLLSTLHTPFRGSRRSASTSHSFCANRKQVRNALRASRFLPTSNDLFISPTRQHSFHSKMPSNTIGIDFFLVWILNHTLFFV